MANAFEAGEGLDFLKDTTAVSAWIESLPKAFATKKLYYAVAKTLLRDVGDADYAEAEKFYGEKMTSYNDALRHIAENQEMTPREKALWIDWPDVELLREKLIKEMMDMDSYQDAVIIGLYSYLPPVRCDYAPLCVYSQEPNDASGNYLVLPEAAGEKAYFIFNEFKTAKSLGRQRLTVPTKLRALLNGWRVLNPGESLLIKKNGTAMTEPALSKRVRQIFKKHTDRNTGINILRHSYATWMRRGEPSLKDQKKIAGAMMHSVGMNNLYRRL
jgi:hypothetical protein